MPVFHTLEQGSAEWLAFRKTKITATMIATIMGVNPYKSAYMLWQEILGLREPDAENDAMRRGKELEPLALKKYMGVKRLYNVVPVVVTHSDLEWALASIDGFHKETNQGVEIKCMGSKNHAKAVEGYIDASHFYQMQWQMFVTDCKEWDYFCFDGENGSLHTVQYNDELIALMLFEADKFRVMLDTITPPPFTDLDYEDKSDDDYWNRLCNMYERHNEQEKCAISEKDKVKKKMIEYANGRNVRGSNSKFTKVTTKGRVDYEKVLDVLNVDKDFVEAYRSPETVSYRITINKD